MSSGTSGRQVEPLRDALNKELKAWQEWEIPRESEDPWDSATQELFYTQDRTSSGEMETEKIAEWLQGINRNLKRSYTVKTFRTPPIRGPKPTKLHAEWWQARIARQKEIDASIAAKAEFEYLYDKPYEDKRESAWLDRSRSRACHRIACLAWMRTTS